MASDVPVTARELRAPFPWYGGKSLAAPLIWRAFGNVPNYVEPFAGSLAVLLARPSTPKVETVNDKDGLISNFWRAVQHAPDEVARWADWPVNEADLHARHRWLVEHGLPLTEKLVADPDFYDAKIAGWWVWGICTWIGNGWCSRDVRAHRSLPRIGSPGHGLHAPSRKKPQTNVPKGLHSRASAAGDVFGVLASRLRHVRVCCGDWTRVVGASTLGIDSDHGMTPCGIVLDPPYAHEGREKRLYREDEDSISGEVRTWALEHGPNPALRIALCGWDGEHEMPRDWTCIPWVSKGSGRNRGKERIWFSPHCAPAIQQGNLFGGEYSAEASP
jgi:DNA adenine methylase